MSFTAEVLVENKPMLHLFEKMFEVNKVVDSGIYYMSMGLGT